MTEGGAAAVGSTMLVALYLRTSSARCLSSLVVLRPPDAAPRLGDRATVERWVNCARMVFVALRPRSGAHCHGLLLVLSTITPSVIVSLIRRGGSGLAREVSLPIKRVQTNKGSDYLYKYNHGSHALPKARRTQLLVL